MTIRRLLIIGGTLIAFAVIMSIYAMKIGAAAEALIASARSIHTTLDAERQVAIWRGRSGREFWEETSSDGEEHTYDIHIENGLLRRLRFVPPTMVGMSIVIHKGELHHVTIMMITGRDPGSTIGVWVQEWFGPSSVGGRVHVNDKDRPRKVAVDLPAGAPESDRRNAFMLNARCLVQLGGCKSAQEMLPSFQDN